MINIQQFTFAPPAKDDVPDSVADITVAKKSIGYAPQWSVHKGLEETIAWFREQDSLDSNAVCCT